MHTHRPWRAQSSCMCANVLLQTKARAFTAHTPVWGGSHGAIIPQRSRVAVYLSTDSNMRHRTVQYRQYSTVHHLCTSAFFSTVQYFPQETLSHRGGTYPTRGGCPTSPELSTSALPWLLLTSGLISFHRLKTLTFISMFMHVGTKRKCEWEVNSNHLSNNKLL